MHDRILLLSQLATTLPLAGLIWVVQWVHYPLFQRVGDNEFCHFHAEHTRRITWIVMPLMMVELATSLAMLQSTPAWCTNAQAWIGLGLVGLAWLGTACLSVPAHNTLAKGKHASTISTLVWTNWIRTIAWTARSAGLLSLLAMRYSP